MAFVFLTFFLSFLSFFLSFFLFFLFYLGGEEQCIVQREVSGLDVLFREEDQRSKKQKMSRWQIFSKKLLQLLSKYLPSEFAQRVES